MPIYEYQCISCGRTFERLAKFDEDNVSCECGAGRAERLFSAFAVGGQAQAPCGSGAATCGIGGDVASGHPGGCACCHERKS